MGLSLLSRIATGDLEAVEDCIQRYGDLVWSLAIKSCGDQGEAEEAANEVFTDLWSSARRYDPRIADETTFVTMVARRRLIDRTGKGHRRPAGGSGTTMSSQVRRLPLDEQVEVARVAEILDGMKPDQRRVIELSLCEGYSHRDITDRLSISPRAVSTHLKKGLMAVGERAQA